MCGNIGLNAEEFFTLIMTIEVQRSEKKKNRIKDSSPFKYFFSLHLYFSGKIQFIW